MDQVRNRHSIALQSHCTSTLERSCVHSTDVLVNRYPSFPANVPDNSREGIIETSYRRSLHQGVLQSNPNAFKRVNLPNSTSSYNKEKKKMQDLVGDLHQIRDAHDKYFKFSRSRVDKMDDPERIVPMVDFLIPEDQTRPRSSGYNSGHVRSALGLDTFGPQSSLKISYQRDAGILPSSPNVDRYSHRPTTGSTIDSSPPQSPSSRCSRQHEPTINEMMRTSGSFLMTKIPSSTSLVGPHHDIPAGTLGYYGPALDEFEKLDRNSFSSSKAYFMSYQHSLREKERNREMLEKRRQHRDKMLQEALSEQEKIREFESRLESAKINNI